MKISSDNASITLIQSSIIVGMAFIAGKSRLIEYFPNSTSQGLALSGIVSGLTLLGTEIVKKDDEDFFTRTLRTTMGFTLGSLILSPLIFKGLKERVSISFTSSFRFTICGVFTNILLGFTLSLFETYEDKSSNPDETWDREEVLKSILSSEVEGLKDAPEAAKCDRDIVSQAVERYGLNIKHASKDLQDDDEIVEKAFTQNPASFRWFSLRIRQNKNWCIRASEKCYLNFIEGVDDSLKSDEDVVRAVVRNYPPAIAHASSEIKNNKSLILNLLTGYGVSIFIYGASSELKKDKNFILQAINLHSSVFNQISSEIQLDQDIILAYQQKYNFEKSKGMY